MLSDPSSSCLIATVVILLGKNTTVIVSFPRYSPVRVTLALFAAICERVTDIDAPYSAVNNVVIKNFCAAPHVASSTMVNSHSSAKTPLLSEKGLGLLTLTAMSCWKMLYACATLATVGVPPVRATFVTPTGDISEASAPEKVKVYGPPALPVTVQFVKTVESNWNAVLTVAEVRPALYVISAVVCPL